ncbi:MAG TPA: aminomethyl-transferring glycine dehydrogenase [Acidimicrobiales bacterium]|nr:aminomethyl-transferring glycine dehydrogenase [Acidimicrobiales bacterium]
MTDEATPRETRFSDRHIGPSPDDVASMLDVLGLASLDELIDQAVPAAIRDDKPLALDDAMSEPEALAHLRGLADRNRVFTSLIGQGYHGTHTPGVILRNVLQNPAWYTAYTPYQPEISQGRLEALLTFQTMVCDLTGLEIANASMLDEGTAAAEAMTLCRRSSSHAGGAFFVDHECHPQTIAVVATRAEPLGIEVVVGDPATDLSPTDTFGVLLQHPGTSGVVRDLRPVIDAVHGAGGLAVVSTDLLACTLLVPPGELGADAAVGSAQRFGVPMGFGGPHAGFLATRDAYRRSLPGRLVGVSVDSAGRPAHRLALQTREQHIRREKATSNICTAQVLLAVMAAMYAVYHGSDGLRAIAGKVQRQTTGLALRLRDAGYELANDTWFDTLTLRTPGQAAEICERARERSLNLRRVDADTVALSLDETTTTPDVTRRLAEIFGLEGGWLAFTPGQGIPEPERRTSDYLIHPVFHEHRSETEMLRYLRRLADKDVALDRAMIPLGSCTMKLNATTEMEPVTWPEFANVHPFAPLDQAEGYLELIHELEAMLGEMTGYDAVSLQPNAGSQGELAGLLAIRAYHRSQGDEQRDVCLIPASAHGTNAASAVMAGMRVVVVACDADGNVDLGDFRSKADEHGERLAALMVTYPSTHGVFEARITEICDVVHEHGGQVYVDGANLNALVGVARPGWFGGDVSHLNLHKTFCIPHGGGGPGVGPVAARAHLAPFLPNHPAAPEAGPATGPGPVSAAPWGSAGILPISYAYAKLMGPDGLRRATEVAILSANYIAARLGEHYPVLYAGEHGRVAHECIIDVRGITRDTGVTVDDVAKRLIDYGFHAPTMSFPVAGTLMIEPTESESLVEIDRFCDAMIAIKAEIDRVASGEWPLADSPLRRAPHTAEDLLVPDWDRPYSREDAAYPVAGLRQAKYWPPVSRIDGSYGDRHLVCACPPPEAFERG